jgi:hypothetical protein
MTCGRWAATSALLLFGIISSAAPAQSCASDNTIEVCVVSAAVTLSSDRYMNGNLGVDVSVTLRVTNITPDPINLATVANTVSFVAENAPAIVPINAPRVSGIGLCTNDCGNPGSQGFTTFTPGKPLLAQISFTGSENRGAIDMLKGARSAVFTASMSVGERGRQRFIPLPAPGFSFGNGLGR